MKLDSRIVEGKKPLTCLDVEQAREFVGKECIFSDFCLNYLDIEKFNIDNDNEHTGILSIDDNSSDYIFINDRNKSRYRFILPREWVKPEEPEKRYRPYTKNEFLAMFEWGKPINIRHKDDGINVFIETLSSVKIDNYMEEVYVRLYERAFNLKELFDEFEWQKSNGEWHPFGVEDKE